MKIKITRKGIMQGKIYDVVYKDGDTYYIKMGNKLKRVNEKDCEVIEK